MQRIYQQLWTIGMVAVLVIGSLWVFSDNKRYPIRQGLDIKGGMHLVLEAQDVPEERTPQGKVVQKAIEVNDEVMKGALAVVRNRVDRLGVSEPLIQRKGERQIVVELAGIKDPEHAAKVLGTTARLEFKEMQDADKFMKAVGQERLKMQADPKFWVATGLTGDMIKQAMAASRGGSGGWVVDVQFNNEGTALFGEITTRLVGKPLGIFLDKTIVSYPVIREPITGGSAEISGNFSAKEAQELAVQLNAGRLPVPLNQVEMRTVDATLGQDSVDASYRAGQIGMAVVAMFMIWYYRLPGVIAVAALLLYTLFSFAIFKLIPVTFTLPGIAGFILSIGMAVDANILIFERMKEEIRGGKSLYSAVEAGFKRAFTSIFDSNMTTLISCAVMYHFGTGLIRGFAVTLAIGVLVSMFTAINVSRTFLRLVLEVQGLKKLWYWGVKELVTDIGAALQDVAVGKAAAK